MNLRPRDYSPGERLTASELNALRAEVARLGRISFVPPLGGAIEQGGVAIWYDAPWAGWVKLTSGGTGGKYAWTAQVETSGGTWANAPGNLNGTTSVDPAYEVNATTTVPLSPNPVVWAWRDAGSGKLLFQMGSC